MNQSDLFTLILTEAAKAGVTELQAVCEVGSLDVFIDGMSPRRMWLYNNLRPHVPASVYFTVSSIDGAPPIVAKPKPRMPRVSVTINGYMLAEDTEEISIDRAYRGSNEYTIRANWTATDPSVLQAIERYLEHGAECDVILLIDDHVSAHWPEALVSGFKIDGAGVAEIDIASERGSMRITRSTGIVLAPKLVPRSPMLPSDAYRDTQLRLRRAFIGTSADSFGYDVQTDQVIVRDADDADIGRIPYNVVTFGTDEELRAEVWCSDCGEPYATPMSKHRRDGQTVCGDCVGQVVVIHKAQTIGATRVITSAEEYERLYGRKPDPSLFAPKPLMFLPLPDHAVTEDRTYHIEELTLGRRPHGYVCSCWLCELGSNGPWHEHEAASRVDYGGECAKAAGYGLYSFIAGARTERDCRPEDDR